MLHALLYGTIPEGYPGVRLTVWCTNHNEIGTWFGQLVAMTRSKLSPRRKKASPIYQTERKWLRHMSNLTRLSDAVALFCFRAKKKKREENGEITIKFLSRIRADSFLCGTCHAGIFGRRSCQRGRNNGRDLLRAHRLITGTMEYERNVDGFTAFPHPQRIHNSDLTKAIFNPSPIFVLSHTMEQ